jgi:hypothetical protein
MRWYVFAAFIFGTLMAGEVSKPRRPSFFSLFMLGMFVLLPLFQLFRRWLAGVGPQMPVRLRLDATGFEQRIGAGPLKLTRWDPRMRIRLKAAPKGYHSLVLTWAPGSFVLTTKSELVNFEFDGDSSQARSLVWLMDRWISESRVP